MTIDKKNARLFICYPLGRTTEIEIPSGYTHIPDGIMQEGDMYLVGGPHNAWILSPPTFDNIEPERFGFEIHHQALIIRKTKC